MNTDLKKLVWLTDLHLVGSSVEWPSDTDPWRQGELSVLLCHW